MQPNRARLTVARVESFTCPAGKSQAFLWDTEAPALLVRATPTGRKTYAVEGRLNGKTLRLTIGDVRTWPLGEARAEAARLKMLVDSGTDPRAKWRASSKPSAKPRKPGRMPRPSPWGRHGPLRTCLRSPPTILG